MTKLKLAPVKKQPIHEIIKFRFQSTFITLPSFLLIYLILFLKRVKLPNAKSRQKPKNKRRISIKEKSTLVEMGYFL